MIWDEFRRSFSKEDAELSWQNLIHSSNGSIEKARRLKDYNPRYSSLQAIEESLKSSTIPSL